MKKILLAAMVALSVGNVSARGLDMLQKIDADSKACAEKLGVVSQDDIQSAAYDQPKWFKEFQKLPAAQAKAEFIKFSIQNEMASDAIKESIARGLNCSEIESQKQMLFKATEKAAEVYQACGYNALVQMQLDVEDGTFLKGSGALDESKVNAALGTYVTDFYKKFSTFESCLMEQAGIHHASPLSSLHGGPSFKQDAAVHLISQTK